MSDLVQAELPLNITVAPAPGMRVTRHPGGEIRIQPTARLELEGSTTDAARILGVSDRTVRTMIAEGSLRARRPAKRWLVVDLIHAWELREAGKTG